MGLVSWRRLFPSIYVSNGGLYVWGGRNYHRIVRKSGKEPNRDESYRPMLLIPRLLLKKFIETIVNQKHSRIQQVCRIITENAIKKNICSQPFFSTSPRHSISCGTKVCCINYI